MKTSIQWVAFGLVVTFLVAAIFFIQLKNGEERKNIAKNIAHEVDENATLVYVIANEPISENGRCLSWRYTFSNLTQLNSPNTYKAIKITLFWNETYFVRFNATSPVENQPISDWNIDSDEAYTIALNNKEIKAFMAHDPGVYVFSLSNSSGTPTWYIDFTYDAGFDNPKWAEIRIDANTGEVLYVEVDD